MDANTEVSFVNVQTHSNQSTATSRLMSWVGRPTAVRIKSIVTSPALGMLAAPILARVAVILDESIATEHSVTFSNHTLHSQLSTKSVG